MFPNNYTKRIPDAPLVVLIQPRKELVRKKDKNNGDVILNEALNIAADLSKMQ